MLQACLTAAGEVVCPDGYEIMAAVADNDIHGSARGTCNRVQSLFPYRLHYVIEPERGLSSVRNRLLNEAVQLDADWLAFIDDDELPHKMWLVNFTRNIPAYSPDVLCGPLVQFNEGETPPAPDELHVKRPTGSVPRHTATNNVMFKAKLAAAQGLRFDPYFNFIGGEDFDFFSRSKALGNRHVWIAEAIVYEAVPPERTTNRYLFYRHFTGGINAVLRYRKTHNLLSTWARYAPKVLGKLAGSLFYLIRGVLPSGGKHIKKSIKAVANTCGYLAGLMNIVVERYRKIDGN